MWSAVYALYRLQKKIPTRLSTFMILAAGLYLMFFWSYGSQQRLVNNLSLQYEYNRVLEYMEQHYPKRGHTVIIAEQPNLYIIHEYSGVRFSRIDKILEALSSPNSVDHIIALQKIYRKTGRITKGSILRGPFQSRPLTEFSLSSELAMRISECTLTGELKKTSTDQTK